MLDLMSKFSLIGTVQKESSFDSDSPEAAKYKYYVYKPLLLKEGSGDKNKKLFLIVPKNFGKYLILLMKNSYVLEIQVYKKAGSEIINPVQPILSYLFTNIKIYKEQPELFRPTGAFLLFYRFGSLAVVGSYEQVV